MHVAVKSGSWDAGGSTLKPLSPTCRSRKAYRTSASSTSVCLLIVDPLTGCSQTMVLVQMAEAGDTSVGNIQADSRSTETSLDLAEELFVTCRFTEAASVCNDALLSSSNSRSNSSIGGRSSASLGPVVVFGDQVIAPVGECDTSDLVVAVLLQCGFELRRTEEWARCRAFYGTGRAIPFAVAVLW